MQWEPVEFPELQILGQGTQRADCAEARGDSTVGHVCDVPIVVQRQVPTVLIVQKLEEMPLLQFTIKVVDI